jgi:hypothetical protein
MGLPNINITFREHGITAISRSQRGIVALILKDTVPEENPVTVLTPADIPKTLNDFNKEQIELALKGYQTPPKKVIVYVIPKDAEDYSEVQNYLETIRWDYVAVPEIKDTEVNSFATWIKALRDTKKKKVKAVLPNTPADHEGIINFATNRIVTANKEYTTAEYCSRIAGLIAGTPLTISCTFAPLPEVIDCDKMTIEELDTAIDEGKLVLYNDGEKIKVARGVNSLKTTTEGKLDSFKKIKIIEAMDLMHDDIKKTAEDNYLGKYSNSYDNKCLLIVAIQGYLEGLEIDGILSRGKTEVGINLETQANYLKSTGYKTNDGRTVEEMKELEIKQADTRDKVFLYAKCKILDAIEEIDLPITI